MAAVSTSSLRTRRHVPSKCLSACRRAACKFAVGVPERAACQIVGTVGQTEQQVLGADRVGAVGEFVFDLLQLVQMGLYRRQPAIQRGVAAAAAPAAQLGDAGADAAAAL